MPQPGTQRLADYLKHMLEAVRLVQTYIDGMDQTAFLQDKRTQQAVVLNILVIGEAATKIVQQYPEFIATHSEVPWHNMRGMRNKLAHGYFDIDLEVVWSTVKNSLPTLDAQLAAITAST